MGLLVHTQLIHTRCCTDYKCTAEIQAKIISCENCCVLFGIQCGCYARLQSDELISVKIKGERAANASNHTHACNDILMCTSDE